MPELNLGHVRAVPDYTQNDPNGAGYIKNRPCYFTGNILEDAVISNLAVPLDDMMAYSGAQLESGESYRITINNISIELTAILESVDASTAISIGDSYATYVAAQNGEDDFTPIYGFIFVILQTSGHQNIGLIQSDGTGGMLMSAFGLTADELSAGTVSVSVTHLTPEAVKLDRRLLPDEVATKEYVNELLGVIENGAY